MEAEYNSIYKNTGIVNMDIEFMSYSYISWTTMIQDTYTYRLESLQIIQDISTYMWNHSHIDTDKQTHTHMLNGWEVYNKCICKTYKENNPNYWTVS